MNEIHRLGSIADPYLQLNDTVSMAAESIALVWNNKLHYGVLDSH